ncbi:DUF2911 domain-containing protein [Oceanihabitans sp. 2_MG-2023]|uniref:DUF2911 domain-containing protein n=1 Tax=Oceanihabitans sp. 2_MG-2023 TaxID=3062661 RepID=UPI0026E1501F|nr:DUF2911 domain-containing protein [Oceanihabitans sp. 2_MG-2023]MDO6598198.1 DUF2911 domain-containing protein [Oceanihabitans sp. 2_MG-2023]
MKTQTGLSTIIMAFLMLFTFNLNAQDFTGLDKSPMDAAYFPSSHKEANKLIKVVYSRPQLKERSLEKLAPNGKVWRTGANEAAEITLYKDMKLGNTLIKAGTYSLATIPGEKEWTIIINSDLNAWGSYSYKEANDVARISVPVGSSEKTIEAFSIAFNEAKTGVDMYLGWDKVVVKVPFSL